jgi:hemoglobin
MNHTPGKDDQFEDRERVETLRLVTNTGQDAEGNIYELVGGKKFFESLCKAFYVGVKDDELLRPMYPEEDLGPAAERLQLFLEQYWGGPKTYQETRGHPQLRLRHAPFKINPAARAAWLKHMRQALEDQNLPPLLENQMWAYLDRAATAMLNTMED